MNKLLSRSVITAAVLGTNQALAGGLWLNEFGDFAAGRASIVFRYVDILKRQLLFIVNPIVILFEWIFLTHLFPLVKIKEILCSLIS